MAHVHRDVTLSGSAFAVERLSQGKKIKRQDDEEEPDGICDPEDPEDPDCDDDDDDEIPDGVCDPDDPDDPDCEDDDVGDDDDDDN